MQRPNEIKTYDQMDNPSEKDLLSFHVRSKALITQIREKSNDIYSRAYSFVGSVRVIILVTREEN